MGLWQACRHGHHASLSAVKKRAIGLGLLLGVVLTGCAPLVNLDSAEFANAPECANMIVRLPDEVAGLKARTVNAQATAAYGDPTAVILRCGLERPGPNLLPCFTVDGVDWLRDDTFDPEFVFTTYGLDPATEVIVDSAAVSGTAVLQEVSRAVGSQSSPVAQCLDVTDVVN